MADKGSAKRQKTSSNDAFVGFPMDASLEKRCGNLLKSISKRKMAAAFLVPVDWRGLGIPTYPQVIKQPMDLGTAEQMLTQSKFSTLEVFASTLRLVWKNAMTFNQPGDPIFKNAKGLSDIFEKQLGELEESLATTDPSWSQLSPMAGCKLLLEDFHSNPMSEWFQTPVDWQTLQLLDYPDVIKKPMDLGTIGRGFSRYSSPQDFGEDMRLVWSNAVKYNGKDSAIGTIAAILGDVFEKRFALVCAPKPSRDVNRPLPDRPGWPSFDEKKRFYEACTLLKLEELNHLVKIVQKGCSNALDKCAQDEVEIDVDRLDYETFKEADKYARTTSQKARK